MSRRRFESDRTRKKDPQRLGDVVTQLMARRGYGQVISSEAIQTAWQSIVGPLETQCLPGNIKRGVLEIIVRNSLVMQELTFQKESLLRELQANVPESNISDLRFKIGVID